MEEQPLYAPTSDERILAILSHVLALVPSIGILGPLVIYLLKKEESGFVKENAKESLNFQLTVILGYLLSFILMVALIGVFLAGVVFVVNTILVIVATIKASENKIYRYPFNLRLIR